MNSRNTSLFRFFFVCVDMVTLNLVYITLILNFNRIPVDGEKPYALLYLIGNIIWLISAYCVALYIEQGRPNVYKFAKQTFKAFILFVSFIFMFAFLYHYPYSRVFVSIYLSGFF